MKINRTELLDQLYQFALGDHGLVVGKPGIGKSYMLRELKRKLLENNILSFIIKIDNAFNSSDQAIQAELKLEGNWIEILSKIKLRNEHKAVLIFDAFDAARNEDVRKGFLTQINKAKKLLQDKWNILVSVRTYDASKSVELIKIFPGNLNQSNLNYSRKIVVGELTDEELEQVFTENASIRILYQRISRELKEILHIPFFLQLFEIIASQLSSDQLDHIRNIKSETQLLNTFWQLKIINTDNHLAKEKLLSKLTWALVNRRSLSYFKSDLLPALEWDDIQAFEYLRSENVLDEVSLNNSRISFSHNILFDFAVSIYCISSDSEGVRAFIKEDTTRPFFLRPSFLYFFTTLWYENAQAFWALYDLLRRDVSKEILLMVRLILSGVIATEFSEADELSPILTTTNNENNIAIRNLLQSIRFIRKRTLPQDVRLLENLSHRLSYIYVFEFAFLLERSVGDFTDGDLFEKSGIASRNLLKYVFDNRDSDYREYLDRIAAQRGIELIAKTYATNPLASRNELEKILDLINKPGFDISFFSNLAEYSSFIIPTDPGFVAQIYNTIFNYQESSQEQTKMGGGVVFNFLSNRRQDFEMCYYRLQKLFPEFIDAAPEIAFPLGIEIVNNAVLADRMMDRAIRSSPFKFEDINAEIIHDFSSLWGDRLYGNKPVELTFDIINFLEFLIEKDDIPALHKYLRVFISNARVGFLWKQLFKIAAKYPEQLIQQVYPIIVVPHMFSATETSFEIRELIEKGAKFLSDKELLEIELLAVGLYPIDTKPEALQTVLSRIPANRLQTDFAKAFMTGKAHVDNEPGMRSSFSSSVYTNEEWLKDKGVNVTTPTFKHVNKLVNQLDVFNNAFLNSEPYYEEYKPLLSIGKEAFYSILTADDLADDVFFTVLTAISKTVTIASRNIETLTEEDFAFMKKSSLFAFNYISKYEPDDKESSPARGYSPTARIEAAEALLNLYIYQKDDELVAAFQKAIQQENSIIRFNAIRNFIKLFNVDYSLYRQLLLDRLRNENDFFVYASLLQNVMFKTVRLNEDAAELLKIAYSKKEFFTYSNSFLDSYTELLLWALANEVDVAYTILYNAYEYPEFCHTVIFRMFEKMHPSFPENDYKEIDNQTKTKIGVILHYVEQAGNALIDLPEEMFAKKSPEVSAAFKILDQVVIRIFFAVDVKSYNRNDFTLPINEKNRGSFYFAVKPVFQSIISVSEKITDKGFIIGHTAHYFMQSLNILLHYDPKEILSMLATITKCSIQGGYTFDSFAIQEVVHITEKLLADHRSLLLEEKSFQDLLDILDIYINSGWPNALELLWQLDEIFK